MTKKQHVSLVWFRYDLRCKDNPALFQACEAGSVVPVFIHDTQDPHPIGAASRAWLDHSLMSLNASLNHCLHVDTGIVLDILMHFCRHYDVQSIFWNRCYTPYGIERDTVLKKHLSEQGYKVTTSNGSLLWEPWTVHKADGTPYKVFTPFYRKGCLQGPPPRTVLCAPSNPKYIKPPQQYTVEKHIHKIIQDQHQGRLQQWRIGEKNALERFDQFTQEGLDDYKEGRNFPAQKNVSRLSPHLHFGEISPHFIWNALSSRTQDRNVDHFLSELGWREFSHALLFENPTMHKENIQKKFDRFPWRDDPVNLEKWQKGKTGIPIVDAGMRELLRTGYMHNRLRMIVGSFLVKNLRIHWTHGEQWFWHHLFDADRANNCAGWQWIAGSGADAAPYFRIFNPVTQGEKFDPDGTYTRCYVPELQDIPLKYLFDPWNAPEPIQKTLQGTYPAPIVDLSTSRQQALQAFHSMNL